MRSTRRTAGRLAAAFVVVPAFLAALAGMALAGSGSVVITGSGEGTAAATTTNPDTGTRVDFQGAFHGSPIRSGTQRGTIRLPGFVQNGRETGTMAITGAQGSLDLQLLGAEPVPGFPPVAGVHELTWVLTGGTGPFAGAQGSGTVALTFTPLFSPGPSVREFHESVRFGSG